MLAPNQEEFRGPLPIVKTSGEPGEVFRYGIGAAAVQDSGRGVEIERPYTVYVMEDEGSLARQIRVFRTALWGYLGIAGAVLLLLQTLVLRWSLWPLRNVVNRSEEHTSELQSLMRISYAVFCLKKKTQHTL